MRSGFDNTIWQTLDKLAWQQIKAESDIVEKDGFGVKVLRCNNGDYIKTFRVKHKISLARILNPAKRFCGNAEKLRALGVDTLVPLALYSLPDNRWAARYQPLDGETLRALIKKSTLSEKNIADLGAYVAKLHDKGIYFRSLHPGNVVLQPNGELGLIDILDCRFRWLNRPLNAWQRERNLQHFFRYEDGKLIEKALRAAYSFSTQ
jgi:tRNA A-37 threonylcarbamoyl transferase component Bud32